jgi:hypothetical protein
VLTVRRLVAQMVAFWPSCALGGHPGLIEKPAVDLGSMTIEPGSGLNGLGMVMFFSPRALMSMPLNKKCWPPWPTWLVAPSQSPQPMVQPLLNQLLRRNQRRPCEALHTWGALWRGRRAQRVCLG